MDVKKNFVRMDSIYKRKGKEELRLMNSPLYMTLKDEICEMIEWLASYGKTENGGVTRLLYTKEWYDAQQALKEKMETFGITTYFDDVGNLFGRLEGTEDREKVILTGSHVDTVIDGGKYDGAYGILASLLAAKTLFAKYGSPKKTIEVVSLCEEEGSRFPLAFWGSGSITGRYTIKDVQTYKDVNGVAFLDAMFRLGFGKGRYKTPQRTNIESFIEVHIEQGEVLEKSDKSVGIVSDIVGQKRWQIEVKGESNHAGTTPMNLRKDALKMASELIVAVSKLAVEKFPGLVATVGHIEAVPNVGNVIAGNVLFSLDIRHHQKEVLAAYCQSVMMYIDEISKREKMDILVAEAVDISPVHMDEQGTELLLNIASDKSISYKKMVSGAGHDSQVFGTYCPTSLIFVPSRDGISHSPKEYTKADDLENGIIMLMEMLYRAAY